MGYPGDQTWTLSSLIQSGCSRSRRYDSSRRARLWPTNKMKNATSTPNSKKKKHKIRINPDFRTPGQKKLTPPSRHRNLSPPASVQSVHTSPIYCIDFKCFMVGSNVGFDFTKKIYSFREEVEMRQNPVI